MKTYTFAYIQGMETFFKLRQIEFTRDLEKGAISFIAKDTEEMLFRLGAEFGKFYETMDITTI